MFVAAIGDVSRFGTAPLLACWAGLPPKHHESDSHVHRGRWASTTSVEVAWRERIIDASSTAPLVHNSSMMTFSLWLVGELWSRVASILR